MCNANYVQHDTQSIYWPGMDFAGLPWVWQEGLSEHTVSVHLRTAARLRVNCREWTVCIVCISLAVFLDTLS